MADLQKRMAAEGEETTRIKKMASETSVLVTGVPLLDESGGKDVEKEVLERIVGVVSLSYPIIMLVVTASPNHCNLVARSNYTLSRAPTKKECNAADWISAILKSYDEEKVTFSGDAKKAFGSLKCESSLKVKDELIGHAFSYLRKNNLMPEEEEEEEYNFDINADL